MINAQASNTFPAVLEGAESGLEGILGVSVLSIGGATVVARRTTGINEIADGLYATAIVAPDDPGDYIVVWDDGTIPDPETYTETLKVYAGRPPELGADWAPTVADVGALLRARTRTDAGVELGTFTADTRPTATEAESYIDDAVNEVLLQVPSEIDIPARLESAANRLASLRAAMAVELSYNPDRTEEGSAYARLKELYDQGMVVFLAAMDTAGVDDTPFGDFATIPVRSPTNPNYIDPLV